MATHTSIIQTCIVSPKRLIQIFIFMLIIKSYRTEDPYFKRCWLSINGYRYQTTKSVLNKTLQQCKDYCEHELPHCNLIVFDAPAGNKACSVKNNIDPFNHSFFEIRQNIVTYILDLECSRNVPSCWTMKGDYIFAGLQHFGDPKGTLESCKNQCIHDFPNCDVIHYAYPEFKGDGCYIKMHAGPLDKFSPMENMVLFVLNRTCLPTATTTTTTTTTTTETQAAGSDDSSGTSFMEKYYAYVLAVAGATVGILLMTGIAIAGMLKGISSDVTGPFQESESGVE